MASWCEPSEDVDVRPGGGDDPDAACRITPEMDEFWTFPPEEAQR